MTGRSFSAVCTALVLLGVAMSYGGDTTTAKQMPSSIPFTEDQVSRGLAAVEEHCASCHGLTLLGGDQGGPPLAGSFFENRWDERPVVEFFEYMRQQMPPQNPGRLSQSVYLSVLAYVLEQNGYASTEDPLTVEDLEGVHFDVPQEAESAD